MSPDKGVRNTTRIEFMAESYGEYLTPYLHESGGATLNDQGLAALEGA